VLLGLVSSFADTAVISDFCYLVLVVYVFAIVDNEDSALWRLCLLFRRFKWLSVFFSCVYCSYFIAYLSLSGSCPNSIV